MTSLARRSLALSIAFTATLCAPALGQEPPPDPPATGDTPTPPPPSEAAVGCGRSFDRAQELRDEGKLLAARAELVACASDACPEVVHRKCRAWLPDVTARIPSVVLKVVDATGRDVVPARILIDGVAATSGAGPIELDPGAHAVRVERGGASVTEQLTLGESEKLRAVRLRLDAPAVSRAGSGPAAPTAAVPPDGRSGRLSPFVYAGAGLAIAGVAVGSVAGAITLARRSDIAGDCEGESGCTQDDIDSLLVPAHVSTIAFASAGAGAAVAVIAWLLSPARDPVKPRGASLAPLLGPRMLGASASIPLR